MPAHLTPKQAEVLEFIQKFTKEHGYPPAVREIGAALHLKSPSTVHFHMKKLKAAGYLNQTEGKTRAIAISKAGLEAADLDRQPDQVPVVGNVVAGGPILAEENVEDYLTFDTNGKAGEHFALRVRGDSMLYAGILAGDLVVVHRQEHFQNGDIVVALFEDEATVKRYQMKGDHLWLMPENPDYEAIDGENCTLVGRVTAVVRWY